MDNKTIQLAQKLFALSERGVDGEKETAKRMLDVYLLKNNLTLLDIEFDKINEYEICEITNNEIEQAILKNLSWAVSNRRGAFFFTEIKGKRRAFFNVKLTKLEYADFITKWQEYQKSAKLEYNKLLEKHKAELLRFPNAFIHANRIFGVDKHPAEAHSLTKEEKEELAIMLNLASSIDKVSVLKKLN